MYNESELKSFDVMGVARPVSSSHGMSPDTIADRLRPLKPHSWHLKGNQLYGMTDFGPLVQTIPSDRILVGTDDNGLPIFKKVVLSRQ